MTEPELTKLIYELLSSGRNPEHGRLYLKLFYKHVLRLNISAAESDSSKVYKQLMTKKINATIIGKRRGFIWR